MRQAIITKYLGPTNFRGGRIKATAEAGSITIEYSHELNVEQNHEKAAKALADKYGWTNFNTYVGGSYRNGFVFVAVEKENK